MSRALTAEETTAIAKSPLTLIACWVVTDKLGNVSRHTAHDRDIVVDKAGLAGTYLATRPIEGSSFSGRADLAADNLEVQAPLDPDGITLGAIRAGMFSGVRFTIFLTDWAAPANVGIVMQRGVMGNVRLVSEAVAAFELRSLKQLLQQLIVPLCSRTCRAVLGDANCGVDLEPYTVEGVVTAIGTQRRIFTAPDIEDADPVPPPGWFDYGAVAWLSGSNAGMQGEVKIHTAGGVLELLRPMPFNIDIGDTFSVHAGCDRQARPTCRDKFNNLLNFQGEPDAQDAVAVLAEAPQ